MELALEAFNMTRGQSQPTTLDTFTIFPNLPTELRLKIWSFACFPRILPIRHHSITTQTLTFHQQPGRTSNTITKFTSTAHPPAILAACSESRTQALRTYSVAFATTTSPGTIYFSPIHDTLYFPRYREMGYDETIRDFRRLVSNHISTCNARAEKSSESQIWDQVRSIALDYVDVNIKRPWESYNKARLIRSFPKLEVISLVVTPIGGDITAIADLAISSHAATNEMSFAPPAISPEVLLRWWAGFRHSFAMEEKMLESAYASTGKSFASFNLPVVNLVQKCH